MRKRLLQIVLLVAVIGLLLASFQNVSFSQITPSESESASVLKFSGNYSFDVYHGQFRSVHNLELSIPVSLYDYYERKSHIVSGDGDYAKFVTPSAFRFIAENIRRVTDKAQYSDEQFANAVLALVRQVPYVKSSVKYPVEALVENSGDCDVLSLLAASIMKAGGLDVVLLYYKGLNPSHMNVGVYLPFKPVYRTWWMSPTGFEYDNKTYWMAETTPRGAWKVGDRPDLLDNAKPSIVSLEKAEKTSPAQISSSLDGSLVPSVTSVAIASDNSSMNEEERPLRVTGTISPPFPGKSVVMYVGREGLPLETYKTVTDPFGEYSFTWNATQIGTYQITTSWSDSADYAGSDSETLTIFVGAYQPVYSYIDDGTQGTNARTYSPPYSIFLSQSLKDVLNSKLSGTGVSLSGEFIILSGNQSEPKMEVTIPKVERVFYNQRTRQFNVVVVSEERTVVEPVENKQLGFILREDSEDNFSASVGVLEDQQLSQITRILRENSDAAFLNVSDVAKANTWYKVEAKISENTTQARLYEMNNTLLEHSAPADAVGASEMGILMSYAPNSILAFKNLKVESLDKPAPIPVPQSSEQNKPDEIGWLVPFLGVAVLSVVAVGAVVFAKRRKNAKTSQTVTETSSS